MSSSELLPRLLFVVVYRYTVPSRDPLSDGVLRRKVVQLADGSDEPLQPERQGKKPKGSSVYRPFYEPRVIVPMASYLSFAEVLKLGGLTRAAERESYHSFRAEGSSDHAWCTSVHCLS